MWGVFIFDDHRKKKLLPNQLKSLLKIKNPFMKMLNVNINLSPLINKMR